MVTGSDTKQPRYSGLTDILEDLEDDNYGEIHHSEGHKGTIEDPTPMPFIIYSEAVEKLIKAVRDFYEENPDYDLKNYVKTIKKTGIKNIDEIEPDKLDAKVVMAVLVGIVRWERFNDGLMLSCLKNGTVQKLLQRLKDIDESNTSGRKSQEMKKK